MQVQSFSTGRLSVRDWRCDIKIAGRRKALEGALGGLLSARVLAHLPPPLQLARHGGCVSRWITARAAESDVLLVCDTATGRLIGLLILAAGAPASGHREIHVGYLLAEEVWGRGLASELVSGLVAALQGHGPVTLVAGVARDNPASARVLQKAGFRSRAGHSTAQTDMFIRVIGGTGDEVRPSSPV